jgi:hypothetical protein
MSNRYVAIDRLALLLPSRIYDIYTELHHPHEPAFANLNEAVKSITSEETKFVQAQVRAFREYADGLEKAMPKVAAQARSGA